MGLHTGESLEYLSESMTLEQRISLGQEYLINLLEDILNFWHIEVLTDEQIETKKLVSKLLNQLELDGYIYINSHILYPEEDVLNVEEERSLLKALISSLNLSKQDLTVHFLDLSEEHYIGHRWDDSISNSRKFLESVLQEIAASYNLHKNGIPLPKTVYEYPKEVRNYLLKEGLIEAKEKEAIYSIYGLLSHTGSHPYMAKDDQARLLRHLALTTSQFV
jgi:hypothetical protein